MKRWLLTSTFFTLLLTVAVSAQTPLNLRNGAVSTGLWGYYDYQSNGMSPGWLYMDPTNSQKLYATYMNALNGADTNVLSSTRRVGFAFSTNGGTTWTSTREIEPGFRLGFPYIQATADGTPLIICHGDPDGLGVRSLLYFGSPGGTAFFRANEFPRLSAGGRSGDGGAGVIWPAFVINPKDPNAGVYIASLSAAASTNLAPLQIATGELGVSAPWKDFGDSSVTNTSGGRYEIARSAGGKIGIASFTFGSYDFAGIIFSESTDGGTTWSEPTRVFGRETDGIDTLWPSASIDLTYMGETPHIVTTASLNNLYAGQQVIHWSPNTGAHAIAMADSTAGLGLIRARAPKAQANMGYVSYPTISAGSDGQHIVAVFQAAAQTQAGDGTANDPGDAVSSPDGFYYFRLWGVGSSDGGAKWGDPFIIQDFAGDGTDSASIEYPSASEHAMMSDGQFELSMTFQARRYPGMYAFVQANVDGNGTPADHGPINPCFQYFQRNLLGPEKFQSKSSSVGGSTTALNRLAFESAFPNPASSRVSIEYSAAASGPISLDVYNTLGDRVLNLIDKETVYPGGHTSSFDLSSLPAGPYRLVLTQNGQTVSQALKIVR